MRVLLTGANGFLGKEIVSQNTIHEIFKLNKSVGDYQFDLSISIPVFHDIFDLVIHNAGKAHTVPKTGEEVDSFYKVNVEGTLNLLKALECNLPKFFVFISSVAVYGLEDGKFINENTKLGANDPYGLSKILAEKLVQDWCKKHHVVCTVLRLPLLIGDNPPGNLKAMIKGIKMGYYFNIGGGKARKSMVLTSDVAKYLLSVNEIGGVFNLTDGYHPNFKELSNLISKQFGKTFVPNIPIFLAKILALFGDIIGPKFPINSKKLNKIISTLTFDDSKARELFGWNPSLVLEGFIING